MAHVISSASIEAPPGAIWALMCDPHRYPDFADPTDRMLSVPNEEFGLGYEYREYGGIPPFKGESTWHVTAFEPMRRQVHVGDDGAMTFELTIKLDPIDGGTHLAMRIGITPRWYLRPVHAALWPLMMRKRAQSAIDETVRNVRQLVESTHSASHATGADVPRS